MKKYKMLCWGDSPTTPTGFGTVGKYVVKELYKTGLFDIDWLAVNYYGEFYDKEEFPYQLSPARLMDPKDPFGKSMLLRALKKGDYDFLWILNDCPVVQPVVSKLKEMRDLWKKQGRKFPKVVFYYPVDCTVIPEQAEMIRFTDVAVTITHYGKKETLSRMNNIMKDIQVVWHGTDPKIFRPLPDKEKAIFRAKYLGIKDPKTFLWTQINRNSIRKDIARSILAFKNFKKKVPNSKFYIHCMPQDNNLDMIQACRQLGLDLKEDVVFPANFKLQEGGFPPEVLNGFLNAADGFLSTTLGEGWGLCLGPDSQILTDNGVQTIENISIGSKVLAQDGKYHKVLDKTKRIVEDIYRVKPRYSEELLVTKEHPFFVTPDSGQTTKWKNIEEIDTEKDLIAIVRPEGNKGLPDKLDLAEVVDECEYDSKNVWLNMGYSPKNTEWSYSTIIKKYNTTKKIAETARYYLRNKELGNIIISKDVYELAQKLKRDGYTDPEPIKINRYIPVKDKLLGKFFLELIGWYLAEGSCDNNNRLEIDLHKKEINVAYRLKEYVKILFGINTCTVETNGDNKCRLRVSSQIIAKLFSNLCGSGAYNKHVPKFLIGSEKYLTPLIYGYIHGDGHIKPSENHVSYTTASSSLAYQIRNILASNEVLVSLGKYQRNKFSIYTGRVIHAHLDKMKEILKLQDSFARISTRQHKSECITTEKYFFIPLKSKKKEEYNNEVFDICVEDVHSFTANGVLVHNTTTEAMAAGTPVLIGNHSSSPEILGKDGDRGYMYPCNELTWVDNSGYRPVGHMDDIVSKMKQVYNERGTDKQQGIIDRALQWAQEHTWENEAQGFIKIFKHLIELDKNPKKQKQTKNIQAELI